MPLLHFDTLVETILLLLFFKAIIVCKGVYLIEVLMVLFPVLCLINFSFFQSIHNFNTYTRSLEAVIFIALSALYWLVANPAEEANSKWTDIGNNWIVSGLLLYFSSSLFLFVFSKFLAEQYDRQVNFFIWNLHAACVMIMYFLFAKGLSKSASSNG